MELRQLRYFVAVAEELHFRRAAERLYVAQPAVSEQVRKLEAELGVQLFERTNRRVELTEAGGALLEEARRVLCQADAAKLAARNAHDRADGRLRIGYAPDAMPPSVPRALQHLAGSAPRTDVSMETGPTAQLIRGVLDRRLDAAIATLPAPSNDLVVTSLGWQGMAAALPMTDARAFEPMLRLDGLAPARLVTMRRAINPAFHDATLAACRSAGVAPAMFEVSAPSVESVLLAVAAGVGPAILPISVAERHAMPGVRLVPLDADGSAIESAVLTHPDADNPATGAFVRAAVHFSASRPREPELRAGRAALRLAA